MTNQSNPFIKSKLSLQAKGILATIQSVEEISRNELISSTGKSKRSLDYYLSELEDNGLFTRHYKNSLLFYRAINGKRNLLQQDQIICEQNNNSIVAQPIALAQPVAVESVAQPIALSNSNSLKTDSDLTPTIAQPIALAQPVAVRKIPGKHKNTVAQPVALSQDNNLKSQDNSEEIEDIPDLPREAALTMSAQEVIDYVMKKLEISEARERRRTKIDEFLEQEDERKNERDKEIEKTEEYQELKREMDEAMEQQRINPQPLEPPRPNVVLVPRTLADYRPPRKSALEIVAEIRRNRAAEKARKTRKQVHQVLEDGESDEDERACSQVPSFRIKKLYNTWEPGYLYILSLDNIYLKSLFYKFNKFYKLNQKLNQDLNQKLNQDLNQKLNQNLNQFIKFNKLVKNIDLNIYYLKIIYINNRVGEINLKNKISCTSAFSLSNEHQKLNTNSRFFSLSQVKKLSKFDSNLNQNALPLSQSPAAPLWEFEKPKSYFPDFSLTSGFCSWVVEDNFKLPATHVLSNGFN